jgi:hypothetical protein
MYWEVLANEAGKVSTGRAADFWEWIASEPLVFSTFDPRLIYTCRGFPLPING